MVKTVCSSPLTIACIDAIYDTYNIYLQLSLLVSTEKVPPQSNSFHPKTATALEPFENHFICTPAMTTLCTNKESYNSERSFYSVVIVKCYKCCCRNQTNNKTQSMKYTTTAWIDVKSSIPYWKLDIKYIKRGIWNVLFINTKNKRDRKLNQNNIRRLKLRTGLVIIGLLFFCNACRFF